MKEQRSINLTDIASLFLAVYFIWYCLPFMRATFQSSLHKYVFFGCFAIGAALLAAARLQHNGMAIAFQAWHSILVPVVLYMIVMGVLFLCRIGDASEHIRVSFTFWGTAIIYGLFSFDKNAQTRFGKFLLLLFGITTITSVAGVFIDNSAARAIANASQREEAVARDYQLMRKNISGIFNFPRAKGRYIAMCEGDDYWTDPDKLEKQVAYLDSHPGCSLCFHSARQVTVDGSITDGYMRPYRKDRKVSPEEIIDKTSGYAMNSMVFPVEVVEHIPDYYWNCPIGDIPMQLMMAEKGWAYYMDEAMSVYRVGVAGSWTAQMKSGDYEKKQKEYCRQMEAMYREFDRETGGKYHKQAVNAARRIGFLTKVNTKHYDEVLDRKNRKFYRELNFRTRFFIRFEILCPSLYRWLQKKATGRNG